MLAATYSVLLVAGVGVTVVALTRLVVDSWRAAPARSEQVIGVLRARRSADDQGEPWPPQGLPRFPALDGTAALGCFGLAFGADWLTQTLLRRTGELSETGFRAVVDAMVVMSVEALVLRRAGSRAGASGWLPLGAAVLLGIAGAGTVGL